MEIEQQTQSSQANSETQEKEVQGFIEEAQMPSEKELEQEGKQQEKPEVGENVEDKSGFMHGLAVGLGIGCIATFVIVWIAVFFSPKLPQTLTYESMLSIFIYPMVYLLTVGLVALTAGIVREYYARK
ncbi:MAG: hypothetical protein ACPLKQ_01625 [Candidatus Bathyarchaeales archaeon]